MEVSSYYHRDYVQDYPSSKESPLIQRVALAAIPLLATCYRPAGTFFSVFLGSIRSIHSLKNAYTSYQDQKTYLTGKHFLIGCLSTLSVVNCFFNHQTAMAITTSSDTFANLSTVYESFQNEQTSDGLFALTEAVNSLLYLKVLFAPNIETILLSYLLQIAFGAIQSTKEFKKGSIEGGAKLLMTAVHTHRAIPYLHANLQKHSAFIISRREKIASVFHSMAATLASPFWWYTEQGVRIFSPIRINKSDQCSTKTLEVASRISYASLAIFMAPLSVGLAVIELPLRAIANAVQPHPFFYLEGEAKEKTEHINSSFKVFTGNLCAVAGGFSRLFGGVANWKHRIDGILAKILEGDPDVICLQEVNDINAAKALYKGLKKQYAHFFFNIGSKVFSQNSGHFIASKYPISDMLFTPFGLGKGLQAMVNKGLFSFALKCKNQVFSRIFAVHLSPSKEDIDPTKKERSNRSKEINMVIEKIREVAKSQIRSTLIFLGDMNLRWGGKEWKESRISQDFKDPYNQDRQAIQAEDSTCCTDEIIQAFHQNKSENWHNHPMIVDHTLLDNTSDASATTSLVKFFDPRQDPYNALSDHNGLLMNVTIPSEG